MVPLQAAMCREAMLEGSCYIAICNVYRLVNTVLWHKASLRVSLVGMPFECNRILLRSHSHGILHVGKWYILVHVDVRAAKCLGRKEASKLIPDVPGRFVSRSEVLLRKLGAMVTDNSESVRIVRALAVAELLKCLAMLWQRAALLTCYWLQEQTVTCHSSRAISRSTPVAQNKSALQTIDFAAL